MVRSRPTFLRGSRGPFFGPDSKPISELQASQNQTEIASEVGLALSLGTHGLFVGSPQAVGVESNRFTICFLRPIRHRLQVVQMRLFVMVPSVGVASAAFYTHTPPYKLAKMAHSEGQILTTTGGLKTVDLKNEVFLEPDETYAIGFYAPGGQFSGLRMSGTVNCKSVLPFWSFTGTSLPDAVELTESTKDYMDLNKGLVDITYLTPLGKEVL